MEQEKKKAGYRALSTQKDYLKLIGANVINRFGDSLDAIAFSWLVYAITGSAAWSAAILAFNQLPTILLQPFTGVLVERWRKKWMMVLTDVIRGAAVMGLAVLYLMELLNPWIMVLFTLTISTAEAFRVPAGLALVPKILKRELYEFGTGLNSTLSTVMQLTGLGAAGVVIGTFGVQAAILVDAATYFLSALILSLIRYREEPGVKERLNVGRYAANLKEGFDYIRKNRVIVNFCILAFVLNALLVPLNALGVPLTVEVLGKGTEFLSILMMALMLGTGAASFLYPYLQRACSANRIVIISGFALGLSYLGFPVSGSLGSAEWTITALCLLCGFVMGAACGFICSVLGVELMKAVDQDYMARCGGVFNSLGCAATPAASALCSVLAVFCPVSVIFVACGGFSVLLFIYTAVKKIEFEAPKEEIENECNSI